MTTRRCIHDDVAAGVAVFCPADGCPETVLVGGEHVPAGCARDLGWTLLRGDAYPVSAAAARHLDATADDPDVS